MTIDQYASIKPYFASATVDGLTNVDADRIRAYEMYERFYWSVPESFKIVSRSEDVQPIYLPSARNMIEATTRFLGVDWNFLVNPGAGTTGDQDTFRGLFQKLFARERVYSKFAQQKRMGLIRGDALWHITADPLKRPGERISMHTLHPGSFFPIYDEEDPDKIIGCHIVDKIPDPKDDNNTFSRRQTYRRNESGGIDSGLNWYELGKWDDRVNDDTVELIRVVRPLEPLPPTITQLPIYHIKNFTGEEPFGSSQLRGVETVLAAVNQSVSDQDIAISLQGLGVYWTDAGPPRGADGQPGAFVMGPGEIVEVSPGSNFGRVSGISANLPGIEHMKFIIDNASEAMGIPEVARGRADVQVAESGISLYLQMAPLLSQNGEKEVDMISTYDQMFYDIVNMWYPAYEATQPNGVEITAVVGDPMPRNRQAEIQELLDLHAANLITTEMAHKKLEEFGYEFPDGAAEALNEQAKQKAMAADPFGARLEEEGEEPDEEAVPV